MRKRVNSFEEGKKQFEGFQMFNTSSGYLTIDFHQLDFRAEKLTLSAVILQQKPTQN